MGNKYLEKIAELGKEAGSASIHRWHRKRLGFESPVKAKLKEVFGKKPRGATKLDPFTAAARRGEEHRAGYPLNLTQTIEVKKQVNRNKKRLLAREKKYGIKYKPEGK